MTKQPPGTQGPDTIPATRGFALIDPEDGELAPTFEDGSQRGLYGESVPNKELSESRVHTKPINFSEKELQILAQVEADHSLNSFSESVRLCIAGFLFYSGRIEDQDVFARESKKTAKWYRMAKAKREGGLKAT